MISVQAPSNIAIIKYMGKKPGGKNLPENASLSMTLSSLQTRVKFLPNQSSDWTFAHSERFSWSPRSIEKVLRYFQLCDEHLPDLLSTFQLPYKKPKPCEILSENTFPAGVGIASSASSFAAFTLAYSASSVELNSLGKFKQQFQENVQFKSALANLSRQGSGSSCRSFMGPWVLWRGVEVTSVSLKNWPDLVDCVVIFDSNEKSVSSSEAHERVKTSPHWRERVKNTENRLEKILNLNFEEACKLIAEEAVEMHELFHTSHPSFSYMNESTRKFIEFYQRRNRLLPPAAFTLDAGPNPHLLIPASSLDVWKREISEQFSEAKIIVDFAGRGADFL